MAAYALTPRARAAAPYIPLLVYYHQIRLSLHDLLIPPQTLLFHSPHHFRLHVRLWGLYKVKVKNQNQNPNATLVHQEFYKEFAL